jgi:hypothetical protein
MGSSEAKQRLKKNTMRHFYQSVVIRRQYSAPHTHELNVNKNNRTNLVPPLVEPCLEGHDRAGEASHHAQSCV